MYVGLSQLKVITNEKKRQNKSQETFIHYCACRVRVQLYQYASYFSIAKINMHNMHHIIQNYAYI